MITRAHLVIVLGARVVAPPLLAAGRSRPRRVGRQVDLLELLLIQERREAARALVAGGRGQRGGPRERRRRGRRRG